MTALSTRAILQEALDKLTDRENGLLPFVDELAETRRAIAVIEKAQNAKPRAKPGPKTGSSPNGRGPRMSQVARLERVTDLLGGAEDRMAGGTVAEELGWNRDYTQKLLDGWVRGGRLEKRDGRYGLAQAITTD